MSLGYLNRIKRFHFGVQINLLCLLVSLVSFGQNSAELDSLLNQYYNENVSLEEKLQLLKGLSYSFEIPPGESLKYCDTLISLSRQNKQMEFLIEGFKNRSYVYMAMDDYDQSMADAVSAMKIADSINSPLLGATYNVIAHNYSNIKDYDNAINYYRRAIESQLSHTPIDLSHLGATYFNLSDTYLRNDNLDSTYYYLKKSEETLQQLKPEKQQYYDMHKPLLEGNLGVYFFKTGDYEKAIPLIQKSALALQSIDSNGSAEYYNYLTDLYQETGNLEKALQAAQLAITTGKRAGATGELASAYLNLAEVFNEQRNFEQAFNSYKNYKVYYDSALNLPTIQQMAKMRNDFEISSKQKELEIEQYKAKRQKTINYISAVVLVLFVLLMAGMFNRIRYVRKTSRIIEQEKERSDELLKNILPDETANELKTNGKVKAKQFDSVSVLFADFCGFTKITSNMNPEELVHRVDFYFSKFDEIMEAYGLEKIKTIGDAYMCAGGLPYESADHALRMVMAAFDMLDFTEQVKKDDPKDPTRFDIRIGINTGPVVAGVVGTKKFVYDIWGDTVNIASRMESNSEAGQINVAEDTYQLIKNTFDCKFRGMVDVKHKGMMKMYFVNPITNEKKKRLLKETSMPA